MKLEEISERRLSALSSSTETRKMDEDVTKTQRTVVMRQTSRNMATMVLATKWCHGGAICVDSAHS